MLSFHMLSSLSLSALPLSCNGLQHRKIASDKISCNFFRINTSASVDSTPLHLLQNECLHKTLGGRVLWLTRNPTRISVPRSIATIDLSFRRRISAPSDHPKRVTSRHFLLVMWSHHYFPRPKKTRPPI